MLLHDKHESPSMLDQMLCLQRQSMSHAMRSTTWKVPSDPAINGVRRVHPACYRSRAPAFNVTRSGILHLSTRSKMLLRSPHLCQPQLTPGTDREMLAALRHCTPARHKECHIISRFHMRARRWLSSHSSVLLRPYASCRTALAWQSQGHRIAMLTCKALTRASMVSCTYICSPNSQKLTTQ